MSVEKFSISLSRESLVQLEHLRAVMGLNPNIKRSQLIAQVIFDGYCRHQNIKSASLHGFSDCQDDCKTCSDQFVCDFYEEEKNV